ASSLFMTGLHLAAEVCRLCPQEAGVRLSTPPVDRLEARTRRESVPAQLEMRELSAVKTKGETLADLLVYESAGGETARPRVSARTASDDRPYRDRQMFFIELPVLWGVYFRYRRELSPPRKEQWNA